MRLNFLSKRASQARRVAALALMAGGVVWLGSCDKPKAKAPAGPRVSIEAIAVGIEKHIAEKTRADGGYFKLQHGDKELQLALVRIHMEYLADLGHGLHFACVDLVGTDGPVYDVDFFLRGEPGAMVVTETTVHKLNGQPLYAWEQKADGSWLRVPVKDASPRLLGILTGTDEFEFIYRVKLPVLSGPARLWLPLAASDTWQIVAVQKIQAPVSWRELEERQYGNKILFLALGTNDSGKSVEIQYQVCRAEKTPYADSGLTAQQYLAAERLVPVNETFRDLAQEAARDKASDLLRARALYDHVIEKMRYAKYGNGWGCGDAVYACNVRSGNCTDFHAYFIALARAIGIPARFAIGASIPSERNDGGIDGYHCWAEFFAEGKWWPVDISEANKNSSLASYYFGHHPANRFELSRGRNLVVEPGPASGPINFLGFPVLEVAGKSVKAPTEFLFCRAPKNK